MLLRRRNPEGRMSLAEHLRELRNRTLVAIAAVLACSVVGWVEYGRIFERLTEPLSDLARRHGGVVNVNFTGMTDPFSTQLNISLFVGVVLASPVWLAQIWGFVVPGLTRREKRIARLFVAAAVPLFVGGCVVAFLFIPRAVDVLLGFTPPGAYNLQKANDYFDFVLRFMLAFGCAFLFPVFLVALDLAHVMSGRTMLKGWRPTVMLVFVFCAVMTPTPDPWSMLLLAMPMIGLYFAAIGVSVLIDHRRVDERPSWLGLPDDRPSAL